METGGISRFLIAPNGVGIPIPSWIRNPESGSVVHIPMTAECKVEMDPATFTYVVTIHCSPRSFRSRDVGAAVLMGSAKGGYKVGARVVGLGRTAGFFVAQVAGRAVAGSVAMVVFPDGLAAGDLQVIEGAHAGHKITYWVFSD